MIFGNVSAETVGLEPGGEAEGREGAEALEVAAVPVDVPAPVTPMPRPRWFSPSKLSFQRHRTIFLCAATGMILSGFSAALLLWLLYARTAVFPQPSTTPASAPSPSPPPTTVHTQTRTRTSPSLSPPGRHKFEEINRFEEIDKRLGPPTLLEQAVWGSFRPCAACEDSARFGAGRDGGYIMCRELMKDVKAVYSYGIEGRDSFGAAVSDYLGGAPVYQYDCTNPRKPKCPRGLTCNFVFHHECLGKAAGTNKQGWLFSTLRDQMRRNGHLALPGTAKNLSLVLKMDIESAEWPILADPANKPLLALFSQVVLELHDLQWLQRRMLGAMQNLLDLFVVVHVHANNCCPVTWKRGFTVPSVLEVSLVRRGLVRPKPCENLPPYSPLDQRNVKSRAEAPQIRLGFP